MKYLIVFFWCLMINDVFAQVHTVDSLLLQLNHHRKPDTVRVNILNTLSYQHQWLDFDQSFQYADEALRLAEQVEFQSGIATACLRQAHCYWSLGDSERAIDKALRAVKIAENEGLADILAETYRILAISYRDQQELEKAISYIRQAERLSIQEKNWDLLARVYNLAGVIDCTRYLDDSAMVYYTKALLITEEHATTKFHVSQVLSNIGELYLEDNPDQALDYFTSALNSARETRNKSAEAGIVADVGRAYLKKGDFTKADQYLQESLRLSRKLGLKRVSRHAYYALVDLRLQEGKTKEAFNYMKSYYDVRDSLLNGSKTRQIVELETRFEKEKQEQRIQLLEQEKTIQRIWTNVLIVGSLLLLVTIMIIYRLQQLRAGKARQLLEIQQSLNEKLKESDALKSRFFANISHEFRTPLALILGPIKEQLRGSDISSGQRKDLIMIQRNAQRLLSLVNQLLDLSKLEAGKMELSVQQGNIADFLHLLVASFDSFAEHRQVNFIKNISPVETSVGFDSDKVEKIVNNILFNAFKFTPAGGTVIFSFLSYPEKNEVMLSIVDNGRGIPKEEQANIFTPFYQLKHDGEEGQPGTGLGLSLVNELVKLYAGTISLKSEPNEGTRIDVKLPVLHSDAPSEFHLHRNFLEPASHVVQGIPAEAESPAGQKAEEHESILIVEDNGDLRNFIASGFSHRFTVITATNGEEGLESAFKHIPDLIISDVMMPQRNGLDFTNSIKADERTCHIPVILLTAKADSASRIEGLKTGADDYLAKPFSMEELQVRADNLLDLRKRLAENLRKELSSQRDESSGEVSLDQKFVLKVKSAIETNISNSNFSVEMLAAEVNLSRAQLFRKVKALLNMSPSELINDLRLQRAAYLIRARTDNVAQIGYAVGFNEQSYFSKRFRKKFGVSPTEYAN